MICRGCKSDKATHTKMRIIKGVFREICNICTRLKGSGSAKKTGFMFGKHNLLKSNSNKALAKQVRQEYIGTDHDEVRGKDF